MCLSECKKMILVWRKKTGRKMGNVILLIPRTICRDEMTSMARRSRWWRHGLLMRVACGRRRSTHNIGTAVRPRTVLYRHPVWIDSCRSAPPFIHLFRAFFFSFLAVSPPLYLFKLTPIQSPFILPPLVSAALFIGIWSELN